MSRALLIVDVQNDFCEGGALAVTGGVAVAQKISDYATQHRAEYALVVASKDWHAPGSDNGGHFSDTPDYVDTWPMHCVAGTPGAAYHPALAKRRWDLIDHHVLKGQGKPSYSAFEGTTRNGRTLEDLLSANDITDIDVVGIATDYCVFASAMDALLSGMNVRVLTDLVAGVAPESSATALDTLVNAGAEVV